ncbi:MAG: heparan-alpha-glucosaminide N-acetyltransferase domain-containing protein [Bacteroidota bacterium]
MTQRQRLLSLDVFRGLTIALMILVNNPGSWSTVYAPLLHASWHGCTPTDLVFPFFLFIVGVSITLALSKRKERGDPQGAIIQKILRRTLLIFAIGLFLHGFPYFDLSTIRIPGVLQRIAVVYGICAILFLKMSWKNLLRTGVGVLIAYWLIMTLVPVPGIGPANLEATTNLGAWLDNKLLAGHLWSQSKVWDPEGILSTLPALATGISGMLCGLWLRRPLTDYHKLTGLFGSGTLLVAIGLLWGLTFPINKALWTSSYVLYTSGIALLTLATIYWLVDVLGYRRWTKPFVVYGTNALFIYVLSGLIAKSLYLIKLPLADGSTPTLGSWLYQSFYTPLLSPYNASLAYALTNVALLWGLAWILYHKKIFIKV